MVNYDSFRKKSKKDGCEKLRLQTMVDNAASFCMVTNFTTNKTFEASVMYTSKEFYDKAIVYNMSEHNTSPGVTLIQGSRNILLLYPINSVKGDGILDRHIGVVCNHLLPTQKGYFPIYFKFNTSTQQMSNQTEDTLTQHLLARTFGGDAVFVAPSDIDLHINSVFILNNKQWRIIELDTMSSPKLVYATVKEELKTRPNNNSENLVEDTLGLDISTEDNILISGLEYEFTTEAGYFICDKQVEILEKTSETVVIKIPFGIKTLNIQTKQFNNINTLNYIIRST